MLSSVAIGAMGQPFAVRRAWLLSPSGAWTEAARPPLVVDGAQAVDLGDGQLLFAGGYPLGDDPKLPAHPPFSIPFREINGRSRAQPGRTTGAVSLSC